MSDFVLYDHGSLWLLEPQTDEAAAWIEENFGGDGSMRWGDALVIEPRYVAGVVQGIQDEGYTVGRELI
jgi:hypothetical protein